jgi:hypothetical protein
MLEILQDFEQAAAKFRPMLLIGPGLAAVLLGLFIWLGGLGFRKILVALVGAVGGGICGFVFAGRNIAPVAIAAAIGAVVAVIVEKIFITLLAAALAAVSAFFVLAAIYKADFGTGLKQVCSQMPLHSWLVIALLIVILIVAGAYLWRLTSALCCAALGTMLVFAGMTSLLLYKGAAPISHIYSRSSFYAAVFVAMTAFGTFEQLLLCRPPTKQPTTKKDTTETNQTDSEPAPRWRAR